MNFNSNISDYIQSSGVTVKEGKTYLLSLYFNTVPNYIPDVVIQKMNRSGIYDFDTQSNTVRWLHPLFDEQQTGFDWVKTEYRVLFSEFNKERKGTIGACVSRMKAFFVNNPEVRKQDVLDATVAYIKTVDLPMHLKSAHKFIKDGAGANAVSLLEQWVETTLEDRADSSVRNNTRNTMR